MNFRQRLRTETATDHKQLDVVIARMDVFASRRHYGRYLNGMHGLYQIYGAALDVASSTIGIPASAARLQKAIQDDLNATGQEFRPDIVDSNLLEPQKPTSAKTDYQQWAVAYVMEGAAMGARMMQRSANQLIASADQQSPERSKTVAPGASYLSTIAEDSYDRWPKVVTAIESVESHQAEVVDYAKQIFLSAKQIFEAIADES